MKSFVALDFETANMHRSSICSIGLVIVENSKIVSCVYELIKPTPNFYSRWATEIHGIKYQDTVNASEFPEVWNKIASKIKDLPLVAHNSSFDENCLKAVLTAYGLPVHQNPFFCTLRASRKKFPELPNHKLTTVSKHLGFTLENHHNALADAQACAYIAMKIF